MEQLLLPLLSIFAFVVGYLISRGPSFFKRRTSGAQALRLWSLGDQGSRSGGIEYLEDEGVGKATQLFLTALFDNPADFRQEQEVGENLSMFVVSAKDPNGLCALYHKTSSGGVTITIGPKASPTGRVNINYKCVTLVTYLPPQTSSARRIASVESIGYSSIPYDDAEKHLVRVYKRVSAAIDNAVARSIDLSSLGATQVAMLDLIKSHPEEAPKFASDPILGPYCQKILAGDPV